jgi:predicted phage terminase large subunit-like protein
MIIDDPHKEGDAESITMLDQVFNWYATAARTRLAPGASIIFIMTRWHLLDLAGRLLQLQHDDLHADKWREVVLPALAIEDDILGRPAGNALWPERFNRENLLSLKALDDRHFQALYQNNPRGADDIMFNIEQVKWIDDAPASPRFWTCDLATKNNETADYTVLARWTAINDKLILIEAWRSRENFPDVRARLRALARRYPDEKIIFPKELHELLMYQELRAEIGGSQLEAIHMKGDKRQKAAHPSTIVNNGRLSVLRDRESDNDHFVRELGEFPMGRYDDCVDAFSVAAHYVGVPSEIEFFLNGRQNA